MWLGITLDGVRSLISLDDEKTTEILAKLKITKLSVPPYYKKVWTGLASDRKAAEEAALEKFAIL